MSRPRIRTLKPEFFKDEKVNAVSRDARYLTIGLITQADDRGRQQKMEQAILGQVYPTGDVQLKQLRRWLGEIIDVGIAWAYDNGPFSYLWLPHFWRHQRINRPSESDLPPHPDDDYAAMPISEAIKAYNSERIHDQFTESVTDTLTPSRAGVRSAPVPFAGGEKQTTTETAELDANQISAAHDRLKDRRTIFDAWLLSTERDASRTKLDSKRQRIIDRALASHGLADCLAAVRNIGADSWARGANDRGRRFDDIEHALGHAERIEKWRDWTPSVQSGKTADAARSARRLEWLREGAA